MKSKSILLIIGGGIAAYKSLELVRRLREKGATVRVVLTSGALEFITSLSASVLSGQKALTDLFDQEDETEIGHIGLSRAADWIVVAPATADLIAKMANGFAGDLATAVLLATDKPILLAPAMNVRMWHHPATRRNLAMVVADGARLVGPNEGAMACGEWGFGRMAEVGEIVEAIASELEAATGSETGPLAGRHVLVTAGPTEEPIDPVRYLTNRSSGRQGYAIAGAAAALGAHTTLISGPTNLAPPEDVLLVSVQTAREMLEAARAALPAAVAVFCAAVADWRVADRAREKIKKGRAKAAPKLELVETPDILRTLARAGPKRPDLVIGFAAETTRVVENARKKRRAKNADWIVANDVSEATGTFGGDRNRVHLITPTGVEDWPELAKEEVARRLMQRAGEELRAKCVVAE